MISGQWYHPHFWLNRICQNTALFRFSCFRFTVTPTIYMHRTRFALVCKGRVTWWGWFWWLQRLISSELFAKCSALRHRALRQLDLQHKERFAGASFCNSVRFEVTWEKVPVSKYEWVHTKVSSASPACILKRLSAGVYGKDFLSLEDK